uniref:V-SNARE coiled-coil homology domain-containing protein n=1 Tax=Amphiprion percula TaxID=161767 RepID=A0A3P8SUH1_AMPPE
KRNKSKQTKQKQKNPNLFIYISGCLPDGEADGCFRPQVVDIMRVNVDNVLERDQKLSELDDRADALQAGASQFESSAAKLKNKYCILILLLILLLKYINTIFTYNIPYISIFKSYKSKY